MTNIILPKVSNRKYVLTRELLNNKHCLQRAETLLRQQDIVEASQEAKVLLSKWKEIKIPFKLADKELAERFRLFVTRFLS